MAWHGTPWAFHGLVYRGAVAGSRDGEYSTCIPLMRCIESGSWTLAMIQLPLLRYFRYLAESCSVLRRAGQIRHANDSTPSAVCNSIKLCAFLSLANQTLKGHFSILAVPTTNWVVIFSSRIDCGCLPLWPCSSDSDASFYRIRGQSRTAVLQINSTCRFHPLDLISSR